MEIKAIEINHNKLIIDIPKGMELDTENTDVAKGVIMLRKKKDITYEDIVKLGFCVNSEIGIKAQAIAQLINIAKYYNGDWKPDWNISNWNTYRESKYYIYYENSENKYGVGYTTDINWGNVYFKSRDDAKSVIDNPNFRTILDAIYKD